MAGCVCVLPGLLFWLIVSYVFSMYVCVGELRFHYLFFCDSLCETCFNLFCCDLGSRCLCKSGWGSLGVLVLRNPAVASFVLTMLFFLRVCSHELCFCNVGLRARCSQSLFLLLMDFTSRVSFGQGCFRFSFFANFVFTISSFAIKGAFVFASLVETTLGVFV